MNKDLILERIQILCDKKSISLNIAFVESGVGKNFKSNFKTSNPSIGKLTMLANYFGVSVDYLLGKTDEPSPTSSEKIIVPDFTKTAHEKAVIDAYRAQPELQIAVDKLLGVERDGKVYLYTAASSDDKRFDEITEMPTEEWNKIKNAPQTDDDLM